MREIALAVGLKNKDIINFLHSKTKKEMNFCKTIISTYCDNNFCYLLFACDEDFIEVCEKVLRGIIIDYIENIYKIEFLKNKVKLPIKDSLAFNAYIKVLAVFDRSVDESALENIILFNDTFFVDSFLEFRLSPLKAHWLNLASLSCDNLTLFNSSTFVDIIRFLVNTMDSGVYKIKVVCDDAENYKIYNMKNENDKIKKIAECNNSIELISNVLNSCPNYIDVYLSTNQNNEAVSLLSNVFTNRLKIYSKS